jgi:hypothetical protein
LTDVWTAGIVIAHRPYYPAGVVVFQIVMFGAALLSAVPKKWVRIVGFVLLLAGVFVSMAIGLLYVPTFLAAVWVMTRDEPPGVQSGPGPTMRTHN